MTKCLLRLHAAVRIPSQALGDEVDKQLILASKNLLKRFRGGTAATTLRVDHGARCASRVCETEISRMFKRAPSRRPTEEETLARALVDEVAVGKALNLHDAGELFLLVLARENGVAGVPAARARQSIGWRKGKGRRTSRRGCTPNSTSAGAS